MVPEREHQSPRPQAFMLEVQQSDRGQAVRLQCVGMVRGGENSNHSDSAEAGGKMRLHTTFLSETDKKETRRLTCIHFLFVLFLIAGCVLAGLGLN